MPSKYVEPVNPVWRRNTAQELYLAPLVLFQRIDLSIDEWINNNLGSKEFSVLNIEGLPTQVNLMTIENWEE